MLQSHPRAVIRSALIAVVALLAISAGSVAADTTPAIGGTFTQDGTSADVFSSTCQPGTSDSTTCTEQGISAFTGKMTESGSSTRVRNQICVHRATYTYDETGDLTGEPTFEFGCVVDRPAGTLTIGKKLSSITLATTTIELSELVCDEFACEPGPSRDVTVRGTWTGVGPITASRSHSSFDDGICRSRDSGKGSFRSASFAGSLDGQAIGHDAQAGIARGRFSYRTRCAEGSPASFQSVGTAPPLPSYHSSCRPRHGGKEEYPCEDCQSSSLAPGSRWRSLHRS